MRLARRWLAPVPVDIAPMIDVVFQQLIYFLLTSSFVLAPGIRVKLYWLESGFDEFFDF